MVDITRVTKLTDLQHRDDFPILLRNLGRNGTGVELGVFVGEYANCLLSNWYGNLIGVDSYNGGSDFHLLLGAIDLNKQAVAQGRYKIIVNNTDDASKYIPNDLEFVYIDADHYFPSVCRDIEHYRHKVRSCGFLCGHDIDLIGVKTAVDNLSKQLGMTPHITACRSWWFQLP